MVDPIVPIEEISQRLAVLISKIFKSWHLGWAREMPVRPLL